MSVKIFAMTHKRFEVPGNSMYIPMHVGHKNAKEDFGYKEILEYLSLHPEISEKNKRFQRNEGLQKSINEDRVVNVVDLIN